jgi:hypothetical protein
VKLFQKLLEEVDYSKWVKLGVNLGLSCCNNKIIKNKLVATRSGEFIICG